VIDLNTEQAIPSFHPIKNYSLLSQKFREGRKRIKNRQSILSSNDNQKYTAIQVLLKTMHHQGIPKEEMGVRKPLNYPP